jgi:hypothetical protein
MALSKDPGQATAQEFEHSLKDNARQLVEHLEQGQFGEAILVIHEINQARDRGLYPEAGAALDGVKSAEDGIEQVHVVRTILELDQLLGQLLENLSRFHQKVLEDLFIRVKAHAPTPLEAKAGQEIIDLVLS